MKLAIAILVELLALIWGTLTLCNPVVNNNLEILAWLVSLISTFGLLTTSFQINKRPESLVLRALIVSAFVFVLVFASAMLAPMVHMR